MTSSGNNVLNIKANASPKMGQDHVPGGVSVLCWLAAPVAVYYGNLQNLVIRSSSVISSQIGVMSDQLRVSLYIVMPYNVMYHLGEGDFIMFDEIPISTREGPGG